MNLLLYFLDCLFSIDFSGRPTAIGSTASLKCSVVDIPGVNTYYYTKHWKKNSNIIYTTYVSSSSSGGVSGSSPQKNRLRHTDVSTVKLSNVTESDFGQYTCELSISLSPDCNTFSQASPKHFVLEKAGTYILQVSP